MGSLREITCNGAMRAAPSVQPHRPYGRGTSQRGLPRRAPTVDISEAQPKRSASPRLYQALWSHAAPSQNPRQRTSESAQASSPRERYGPENASALPQGDESSLQIV